MPREPEDCPRHELYEVDPEAGGIVRRIPESTQPDLDSVIIPLGEDQFLFVPFDKSEFRPPSI